MGRVDPAKPQYGDASHPFVPGYEALARELLSHLPL